MCNALSGVNITNLKKKKNHIADVDFTWWYSVITYGLNIWKFIEVKVCGLQCWI